MNRGSVSPRFSAVGLKVYSPRQPITHSRVLAAMLSLLLVSCVAPQVSQGPADLHATVDTLSANSSVSSDTANAEPATATVDASDRAFTGDLGTTEVRGIQVRCQVVPLNDRTNNPGIAAGDNVEVTFEITDTTTGTPLTNLNPAGWIHPTSPEPAPDKIRGFLSASMGVRPDVDLNTFYVLAMNEEASITVVDPLFGYGGSRLLARIALPCPADDWVLTSDGSRIYVSLPLVNRVGVVDTASWQLVEEIDVAVHPTRLRLQPDGKYLWVSCLALDGDGARGVISVVDTETRALARTVALGGAHHHMAFDADSRFATVTCPAPSSYAVIDINTLQVIHQQPLGDRLGGIATSALSNKSYVADGAAGVVHVISSETHLPSTTIRALPGLGAIALMPGERYLFVANAIEDEVSIIDVSIDQVIQTADVEPGPEQIVFTENNVHVRSAKSELVLMIPIAQIGQGDRVSVIDYTGGHTPFGSGSMPSSAPGIAMAPDGVSVLVANPVDKAIYYYAEGMAAPMGSFQNYSREPRAVMVIDRSLRETSPGKYTTHVRIPSPGLFDVAFLLDTPRVTHCFELPVARRAVDRDKPESFAVQFGNDARGGELDLPLQAIAGEQLTVRLRVVGTRSGIAAEGLGDVEILTCYPGTWQKRSWGQEVEPGVYEVKITPPRAGVLHIFAQVPSRRLSYSDSPYTVVRVDESRPARDQGD